MRAPLNSRVGSTSGVPKAKGKAKQQTLDHVPLEIQEAMILEDLLYVLMVRVAPPLVVKEHSCYVRE